MTSEHPHFNVSNLEPGTLYQVIVYAYNRKGRSEPVIVQAGTLSPPEKQLTSESGECVTLSLSLSRSRTTS